MPSIIDDFVSLNAALAALESGELSAPECCRPRFSNVTNFDVGAVTITLNAPQVSRAMFLASRVPSWRIPAVYR